MIAAALAGYVVGSLPLGYVAGRRWAGVDLRTVGSQNVGATNMYRVSGLRLGATVLLLDVAKGAGAVLLSGALWPEVPPVSAAVAAVGGHIYPVWLRGRGGKGVATACGAFAVLTPLATAMAAAVFAATVAATRVVSTGSMAASVALPVSAAVSGMAPSTISGASLVAALVLWRHRDNARRLWRGTERRLAAGDATDA